MAIVALIPPGHALYPLMIGDPLHELAISDVPWGQGAADLVDQTVRAAPVDHPVDHRSFEIDIDNGVGASEVCEWEPLELVIGCELVQSRLQQCWGRSEVPLD